MRPEITALESLNRLGKYSVKDASNAFETSNLLAFFRFDVREQFIENNLTKG